MTFKKILLVSWMALIAAALHSQCDITATVSYSGNHVCVGTNLTVSGTATLRKFNGETQSPCGGSVNVQLQKYDSSIPGWVNKGSAYTTAGSYSITILSSYGSGTYRVYITNPGGSCSCSATTPFTSTGYDISFTSSTNTNDYTINGQSTDNVSWVNVCDAANVIMDNFSVTGQSSISTVNQWRVGVSTTSPYTSFTYYPTTGWNSGVPSASLNLAALGLLTPAQNDYGIQLETYNGCHIATHFVLIKILKPSFTYPATLCAGQSITVDGSASSGPISQYQWQIVECNSSGTPTGTTWSGSWTSGAPGSYTFPAAGSGGPTIGCNKYYLVTLSLQNGCTATTSHIVHIFCNPGADAGPDQTICTGDCAIIGVGGRTPANTDYIWNPAGTPTANPKQVSVCPTSTTTYTLTVTDNTTGCVATDQVTITVVSGPQCDNEIMLPNTTPNRHYGTEKSGESGNGGELPVSVYPNPSGGKFTITLDNEISGTVEVYNMLGSLVTAFKKETNNIRYDVDLTGHPKGIYTVRFISNGKPLTYKIILQ